MDLVAKLERNKPLLEHLGRFFLLRDAVHQVEQALIMAFVEEFVDADFLVVIFLPSISNQYLKSRSGETIQTFKFSANFVMSSLKTSSSPNTIVIFPIGSPFYHSSGALAE
jgi:hypothetical protein